MHFAAFLQALDVPANAPWWLGLAVTLFPIASGYLSKFLADGLKQILVPYDKAPSVVKSIVSILIGLVVGYLASKLAVPLDGDLHTWQAGTMGAILTALAQAGIYRVTKNKMLATQAKATMEQQRAMTNPKA